MAAIDISHLSSFQKSILQEVRQKKQGAMWVPMGSGKTIITITLSLLNREEAPPGGDKSPALIVVAKSLISEWVKEIKEFYKDTVPFLVLHSDSCKEVDDFEPSNYHLVITTPEVLTRHYKLFGMAEKVTESREVNRVNTLFYIRPDNPLGTKVRAKNPLFTTRWSTLAIDEAHKYLNHTTARTRAMIGICATNRWLLSGTIFSEPKADNIFGYFLLLNDKTTARNRPEFLKYFGSNAYKGAKHTLVKRDQNEDYIPANLGQTISYNIVTNDLSREEADFFTGVKGTIQVLYSRMEELRDVKEPTDSMKAEKKLLRGMVLGMVGYLRQSLSCPLIPITSMVIAMADYKTRERMVASFTSELVKMNGEWLEKEESVFSSRLRAVVQLVEDHPDDRIVIFSDYRTVLDVLHHYLPKERPTYTLRSHYTFAKRGETIVEWGETEGSILSLTYALGSCGLNLQKGTMVIVVDYGWDIDVTNQAVQRVVRRGQEAESVKVFYLTSNTGIEKAIYDIHVSKKEASKVIEEGGEVKGASGMKLKEIVKLINMDDNYRILSKLTDAK